MARSEARVSVDIWTPGGDFTQLTCGAQWMYLHLLSQPDLTHVGVLPLRERRWSRAAADIKPADIERWLRELEERRFIVVDYDTEEVLIRSLVRRDKVYRQPNVLRSARDSLAMVASTKLKEALRVELQRVLDADDIGQTSRAIVQEMLAMVGGTAPSANPSADSSTTPPALIDIPSGKGSDNPSGNPSENPSGKGSGSTSQARRGTRIPDDFTVTPDMVEWVEEHCPGLDWQQETENFVDYWKARPGKDGTKLDWKATWRVWMRNAHRRHLRGRPRPTSQQSQTVRQPATKRELEGWLS